MERMRMKTWNERVDELADIIVATRDMCGDEPRAIREYFADEGFTRDSVNAPIIADKARIEANRRWHESQRDAGVTAPISPSERRRVNRALR
jgi:hypothetical protein